MNKHQNNSSCYDATITIEYLTPTSAIVIKTVYVINDFKFGGFKVRSLNLRLFFLLVSVFFRLLNWLKILTKGVCLRPNTMFLIEEQNLNIY